MYHKHPESNGELAASFLCFGPDAGDRLLPPAHSSIGEVGELEGAGAPADVAVAVSLDHAPRSPSLSLSFSLQA